MTITSLIVGKLTTDPETRTGNSGRPFTTARMAAGTDDESVLCSVIAFGTAGEQLSKLAKGDSLAIVGRTKPKAWLKDGDPRANLDVVADQILTVYHLRRKRAAMAADTDVQPARQAPHSARSGAAGGHCGGGPEVDDGGDSEGLSGEP